MAPVARDLPLPIKEFPVELETPFTLLSDFIFVMLFFAKVLLQRVSNTFYKGSAPSERVVLAIILTHRKFDQYSNYLADHLSPACRGFTYTNRGGGGGGGGGLSGYTTLPKGLPHARGGTEATYCSYW